VFTNNSVHPTGGTAARKDGVCVFKQFSGLKLVPSKWHPLVPPTRAYRWHAPCKVVDYVSSRLAELYISSFVITHKENLMKKLLYLLPLLFSILACGAQPQSTQNVTNIVNATLTAIAQNNPQVVSPPATFTPISVQVQPTATQQVMPGERNFTLSLDILRYGAYRSPDWGEFQLSDGIFYRTPPTSQESPETYSTRLLDTVLYGDINLDGFEDAVVFLSTQNGGTGHFVEMAAVLNLNGNARNISTLYLGDRVVVESGAVQDGLITLNLRVQGPNDGLCCPSQIATWNFHLDSGQLVQVP